MADYDLNTTAALHDEIVMGHSRASRAQKYKPKHYSDKSNMYTFICVAEACFYILWKSPQGQDNLETSTRWSQFGGKKKTSQKSLKGLLTGTVWG